MGDAVQNRKNRRNGTVWESALRDFFREQGFGAERLRLAGKEDEGDLIVHEPFVDGGERMFVVEAKSGAIRPAAFVREAVAEARNYEKHRGYAPRDATGIVIIKQRGKGVLDSYVLTSVREYFGICDG